MSGRREHGDTSVSFRSCWVASSRIRAARPRPSRARRQANVVVGSTPEGQKRGQLSSRRRRPPMKYLLQIYPHYETDEFEQLPADEQQASTRSTSRSCSYPGWSAATSCSRSRPRRPGARSGRRDTAHGIGPFIDAKEHLGGYLVIDWTISLRRSRSRRGPGGADGRRGRGAAVGGGLGTACCPFRPSLFVVLMTPRARRLTMRVFVAGATGAIGMQLVPRLVTAGHEVHGMTRSGSKQELLSSWGPCRWSPTRSIPVRSRTP